MLAMRGVTAFFLLIPPETIEKIIAPDEKRTAQCLTAWFWTLLLSSCSSAVQRCGSLILIHFHRGSENSEDGSGYGSPTLPTATVIPSPAVTPASSTTVGSTQPVLVSTRPTEGSSEAESIPTTELHDKSNNESLETEEPSVLVYAVPAVLLALLIFLVIAFIVVHKRKKSKQDELGSENVKRQQAEERQRDRAGESCPTGTHAASAPGPASHHEIWPCHEQSPIFEEDTPSVMEIEMEELDKWMNSMNKNADCECLPTVREEEKESMANPSDGES
ncbi:transmembrane protein 154 isoform X1 [Anas platyrhynchos]|uniref:transmembrane protein 154 isoform X1 n=1 Tax=Anas platyrhynchos TaxID=8839 RepID=UPI000A3C3DF6|nr:transmembrane protein 154 isoform X1 [Anas platyrhynchos]